MITERMGIEPQTWYAILSYLYYDAAKPGATQEEIHQTLDQIGPWEVKYAGPPAKVLYHGLPIQGDYIEVIVFSEENTHRALYRWIFTYNQDRRLIEKRCVYLGE